MNQQMMARCVMLLIVLTLSMSPSRANDLQLVLGNDDRIRGRLVGVTSEQSIEIACECFDAPVTVPLEQIQEIIGVDSLSSTLPKWVYSFDDGSRVLLDAEQKIPPTQFRHPILGQVTDSEGQSAGVQESNEIPRLVHSLDFSAHRIRMSAGWTVSNNNTLIAKTQLERGDKTMAALDWDLPSSFQVSLSMRCESTADFELTFGDRFTVAMERQDRRGSSLSRSPDENNQARLEWFDSGVTLLRSDAGLADAMAAPNATRQLEVTLYVNQREGRMAMYRDGQRIGEVRVPSDATKTTRGPRTITLIQRGSPIEIEHLSVSTWAGGTLAPTKRGITAFKSDQPTALELTDGSVVCGAVVGYEADTDSLLVRSPSHQWRVPTDSITRIRLRNRRTEHAAGDAQRDQLVSRQQTGSVHARLTGKLAKSQGRAGQGSAFAFIPHWTKEPWVLKEQPELRVTRGESLVQRTHPLVVLQSGEVLSGLSSPALIGNQLRFRVERISKPALDVTFLSKIAYQPVGVAATKQLLEMARRRAEREQTDPPRNWVASNTGDVMLGELLSLDSQIASIRIRNRARQIDLTRVASIGWTSPPSSDSSENRDSSETQTTVSLSDGTKLQLAEIRATPDGFRGSHQSLGDCTFQLDEIISIAMQ